MKMDNKPCQNYMHDTFFCIGCPIKECEYYKKHNKKVLDDWIKPFVDSVNERFKQC